jgi:hypothetical protein
MAMVILTCIFQILQAATQQLIKQIAELRYRQWTYILRTLSTTMVRMLSVSNLIIQEFNYGQQVY